MDGKKYASMEGFWQSLKFPKDQKDPRFALASWPYRRSEVEQMTAFEAKRAGDFGSKIMQENNIDWVTYQGKRIPYREPSQGAFYKLIRKGMQAKFDQNRKVSNILCSTNFLQLLPDHSQGKNPPPAWEYHKIWMEIRQQNCHKKNT